MERKTPNSAMGISAPYNFVPISEHIILPDWADQVSQDIPFSDGKDGEFSIKLTAVTDIFVRNGVSKGKTSDFSQAPDGRYFLPGTSVKGMIRNVLEIASFSRMRNISDKRYGIRDLNLTAYRRQFTDNDLRSKVQAGFLDISTSDWKIIPCSWGSWLRSSLDKKFGNKRMSAAEKYLEFDKSHPTLKMRANVAFVQGDAAKGAVPHNEVTFADDGKYEGVLVFTGQPQDYNEGDQGKKKREFFFYDLREQEAFPVDDESSTHTDEEGNLVRENQRDFKFIHEEQSAGKDFKAWTTNGKLVEVRKKYFKGRVPVFYIRTGKRLRFGLAAMFRFAGEVSTVEALRNTNVEHYPKPDEVFKPDLSDLIFGYTTSKMSLRGRVQFSGCFTGLGVEPLPEESLVLGNPKPTFFPAYLQQNPNLTDRDKYKTFLDADAKLRGWKRYPALVSQSGVQDTGMKKETQNIDSKFKPLPKGTVFEGKVRYHNLREVELGALLWSIRLKSQKYQCHLLGMAKPYGFGKVKIEIQGIEDDEQNRLCKLFKEYIKSQIGEDFDHIPQIKSLLDMAQYDNVTTKQMFDYMSPKDCSLCKGRNSTDGNAIEPSVLGPYEVVASNNPPPPKPKPKGEEDVAKIIEPLKIDIKNSKKALQYLKKLSATVSDKAIEQIENLLKKEPWYKNGYDSNISKVNAELARLKKHES